MAQEDSVTPPIKRGRAMHDHAEAQGAIAVAGTGTVQLRYTSWRMKGERR